MSRLLCLGAWSLPICNSANPTNLLASFLSIWDSTKYKSFSNAPGLQKISTVLTRRFTSFIKRSSWLVV